MVDLTSKCKYVCKFKKNSSLDVLNPNFFVLHLFYVATCLHQSRRIAQNR